MKYEILWTQNDEDQLSEHSIYIALNTGDVNQALSFIDKIKEESNKLNEFPYRGFNPNDSIIRRKGYKGLIIGSFALLYKIYDNDRKVVIEAFIHLKSDYKHLLY